MSKRIKPNVEHRIVDGEIISGSIDEKILRGRTFSQDKAGQNKSDYSLEQNITIEVPDSNKDEKKDDNNTGNGSMSFQPDDEPKVSIADGVDVSNTQKNTVKKTGFFSKYRGYVLWTLLFIIVIMVLFITRPNTDWEVQKINDMQSEIGQLKQDNVDLNDRLQEQQSNLEQMINDQVSKSISDLKTNNKNAQSPLAQTDLNTFEQKVQHQIELLQKELSELSGTATSQTSETLSKLNKMANNAQNNLQPSDKQLQALKTFEDKLQSEMKGVGKQLKELFDFKSEQQVLTRTPPVLKLDMPLDSLQIQQWIVEVNTQWILNSRPEETEQQLLALEQAVSLSDFEYTTQLARLIGQDLGYLKQVQDNQLSNPLPTTDNLKQAIMKLTGDNIKSQAPAVDAQKSATGLDALLERFSAMITIKKRADDATITDVDSMLSNDVLKQRLSLLVDRLDWGLQTESVNVVYQAAADIKTFIKKHYANEFSEFHLLLEPFVHIQFPSKKNLSIMNLDQVIAK